MNRKCCLLLLIIILANEIVLGEKPDQVKTEYQQALQGLSKILPYAHISRHPVNDTLSARWYHVFLKQLDPRQIYFTQSDMDRFSEYKHQLDEQAKMGDLTFALMVQEIYAKRVRQTTQWGQKFLQIKHDYTIDEDFDIAPVSLPFNDNELKERWRKLVKYELLLEKSYGSKHNEAMIRLGKRYQRIGSQPLIDDEEELFELYLHTFALAFDPHGWYLGERTLIQFR